MYCKKCGTKIPEGSNLCPNCGFESSIEAKTDQVERINAKTNAKTKLTTWIWLALFSLVCGCFTFYKGIDKLLHYDSGNSYPYKAVNTYVGGDAYNFIINGTYATAFFVLTAMFVLAAIGLMIVHYISKNRKRCN